MREVAIFGAGELGGAVAHIIAKHDAADAVRLVDEAGRVAEGKALDIMQSASIEGFSTRVSGSADPMQIGGADIVIIADRFGGVEWQGEDGLMLLQRVARLAPRAVLICAGAAQRDLVDRSTRELHIDRTRIVGSAPEALASAARAIVALAVDGSPLDVSVSVLGNPPAVIIVPWEDAAIAGYAVTRLIDAPTRRRLDARISAMWPPGPYALAAAAAKAVDALVGKTRPTMSCFVAPDNGMGERARAAALPVRLGPRGIEAVVLPTLSTIDRVALENAMML
jgi:malate dehydrogenase